jgi:hypothetical protein
VVREADPFVGVRRGHADVGQDHVGPIPLHPGEHRFDVAVGGHHVDGRRRREKLLEPLADDQAVLGNDDADPHEVTIYALFWVIGALLPPKQAGSATAC